MKAELNPAKARLVELKTYADNFVADARHNHAERLDDLEKYGEATVASLDELSASFLPRHVLHSLRCAVTP